ncbi:hypothetical protein [Kitasatospora sp. NPDC057198]|uniref:hypothetical protein n=1 Tax=Kitasatospora sp. NPDC057198 TaxID=3346046 RepID=UPI003635A8B3
MGRRAKPVAAGASPHLRALAVELREMKARSGLTYAGLAKRAQELAERPGKPPGAATLRGAATGTHLPRLETVRAFARAAADRNSPHAQLGAVERVEALWAAVSIERAAALATEPARPRRSTAGLALGLVQLQARAGRPSLRRLEELSDAAGHRVPRSTLHLILGGRVLPTRDQLVALLVAFDAAAGPGRVVVGNHWKWLVAHEAVEAKLHPDPPGPIFGCADHQLSEILARRERNEAFLRKIGKFNDEDGDGEDDEYRLGVSYDPPPPWEAMDDDELAAWEQEALADDPDDDVGERLAEMARRARARG